MEFVLGYEIFGKEGVLGREYSRVAKADRREAHVSGQGQCKGCWTRGGLKGIR